MQGGSRRTTECQGDSLWLRHRELSKVASARRVTSTLFYHVNRTRYAVARCIERPAKRGNQPFSSIAVRAQPAGQLRGAPCPRGSSVLKIPGPTSARQANGETRAVMQRRCRTSAVIPIDEGSRGRSTQDMAFRLAAQPIAGNDSATWSPAMLALQDHGQRPFGHYDDQRRRDYSCALLKERHLVGGQSTRRP
jgi:hypothetical protein